VYIVKLMFVIINSILGDRLDMWRPTSADCLLTYCWAQLLYIWICCLHANLWPDYRNIV